MEGFGDSTYGDAFADVYDDWYGDVTDIDATVARLVEVAGAAGRLLELGVGTGRLAIPLARAGLDVVGIDSSEAMLGRLRADDPHGTVDARLGDMVDDLPPGPFEAVLAAYNTVFNLLEAERQRACFGAVADRLAPDGRFVVEAFVPDADASRRSVLTLRSMTADRVVLSASEHDPEAQRASGQFIELTETAGVRLRPWAIRWATPGELDDMAGEVGLGLIARWAGMDGAPFDAASTHHVSVYALRRSDSHRRS